MFSQESEVAHNIGLGAAELARDEQTAFKGYIRLLEVKLYGQRGDKHAIFLSERRHS